MELTNDKIRELAKLAKLPTTADIKVFGENISVAIQIYLDEKTPNYINKELKTLYKLAKAVTDGDDGKIKNLLEKFKIISTGAKRELGKHGKYAPPIPTNEELENIETCKNAANILQRLITYGGCMKKGRNRPTGKQSRPTFKPYWDLPIVNPGWSSRQPELYLIRCLGMAYFEAIGKPAPYTADSRMRTNGGLIASPFTRLVVEVLKIAGKPNINAVELVNKYGTMREKQYSGKPAKSNRLKICCHF